MGLDKVQEYMIANRVHEIKDFSAHRLDDTALHLQAELQEKFRVLPIRGTKAFITVSTDKLKKGSPAYNTACAVWHDAIPVILPNLLKFITYIHPRIYVWISLTYSKDMPTPSTILPIGQIFQWNFNRSSKRS